MEFFFKIKLFSDRKIKCEKKNMKESTDHWSRHHYLSHINILLVGVVVEILFIFIIK